MKSLVLHTVQRRLSELQRARERITGDMRREVETVWGQEHVERKQQHTRELEKVAVEMQELEQMTGELEQQRKRVVTYTLESEGRRSVVIIVPSPLLVSSRDGFISHEAPLARLLLNAVAGQVVRLTTPIGERIYKVVAVI